MIRLEKEKLDILRPMFRQIRFHMGIASTLAAKLILACLDRGLFVSWDAANLMSVGLAEKLGFVREEPYDCFWFPKK